MNKPRRAFYLQPQAEADLREIGDYIAQDNRAAAKQLIESIHEKCELLTHFPDMGQPRHDVSEELRHFPVGRYLILYRITERSLEVVRVLHSTRGS